MGSQKHFEKLAETFVMRLNQQSFEPKRAQEIPASCVVQPPSRCQTGSRGRLCLVHPIPGQHHSNRSFLDAIHLLFKVLISRYRFCQFEVGPIMFFANYRRTCFFTSSRIMYLRTNICLRFYFTRLFAIRPGCRRHYDPICFTPGGLNDKKESPIVCLDHEEILIRDRVKIMEEISPSIEEFMERTISGEFEVELRHSLSPC